MTRKHYGGIIGQPPQHDSLAPSGVFSVGSLSEGTGYDVPSLDLSFDGQASSYRRTSTSPTASKANGDELATNLITCTRNSVAYFLDSSGNLAQAGTGVPRVEYDPSGNPLGLLIEEARTNLVGESEINKAGGYWTNGGTTANQLTDLSGNYLNQFGGMRVESNGQTWHHTRHEMPGSFTSGTAYAFTLFLRFETRQDGTDGQIRVQFRDLDGGNNTQMSGSSSGVSASSTQNAGTTTDIVVTDMGGGNHKLTCKFTPNFTGSRLRVDLGPNSAQGPANGQPGDTVVVLACQMEEGEGPTSYIPTSGNNTATRPRDEITVATNTFGVNPAEETIAIDFEQASPPSATNPRIYELHSGSTTSRSMVLYVATGTSDVRAQWIAGGNTTTQVVATAASYPVAYKIAQRRDGTSGNYAADGSLGTSTTITQGSTAPTTLSLGCNSGGGGTMNGHIRRLIYFPRALSDYSLIQYTTGSGPTEQNRTVRKWGGMVGSGVSDEPSAVLKLAEDYQSSLIGLP